MRNYIKEKKTIEDSLTKGRVNSMKINVNRPVIR